jgi:nucleoside-diphosphate-sugar epimerase
MNSETQLEAILSEPSPDDINDLCHLDGDILVLGAGGKMGPTLAMRAARALQAGGSRRRVIAVSRFSDASVVNRLQSFGIDIVQADLLNPDAYADLPDAENVIHMVARKFGTVGEESVTWATNAFAPGLVGYRYKQSRIVTWSTGNVYPLYPIDSSGPPETSPVGPIGEYAQSALARERVFTYFARTFETRLSILRLNYAVELRYGVLVDIACKVVGGQPVNLGMGAVNLIWQGHANSVCLRSLHHCHAVPFLLNVTSMESFRVRWLAEQFGKLLGVAPEFEGTEGEHALLSNASKCQELFGPSAVPISQVMQWTADWLKSGGSIWNKPTHFEVKDGKF